MKNIVAIVVCAMLFRITLSEELLLCFEELTPVNNENQFVVEEGLSVTLVCIVPTTAFGPPTITKLTDSAETDLVQDGFLVPFRSDKYVLRSFGNTYELTINDISVDDTADYTCESFEIGFFCFPHTCVFLHMAAVQLVVQLSQQLPMPMCFENSLVRGLYFAGDDVTFVCLIPRRGEDSGSGEAGTFDDISDFRVDIISNNNEGVSLTPERTEPLQDSIGTDVDYHKVIYTVNDVDEKYNGTSIVCYFGRDKNNENFCDHLPKWKIFRQMTVSLNPTIATIQNGGSVTFTCNSVPTGDTSNVDWMVSEGNYTIGSFRSWQTSQGSMLALQNIQFGTEGSGVFEVSCHVTFGSMDVSKQALCSLQNPDDMATVAMTSPGKENGFANGRSAPVSITIVIIPIVVVVVLTLLVTSVLIVLIRNRQNLGSKYTEESVEPKSRVESNSSEQKAEISGQYDKICDGNKLIMKDPHDAQYTQDDHGHVNGCTANISNEYTTMELQAQGSEAPIASRLGYTSGIDESETSLSERLHLGLSRDESERVRNIIYEPYD